MYQNKKCNTYSFSTAKMATFGQEDNIFSICSSTGEFFLDFLKVLSPANIFLSSFTDCYTSRGSAYDVTAAESHADAYRSSSKRMTECHYRL